MSSAPTVTAAASRPRTSAKRRGATSWGKHHLGIAIAGAVVGFALPAHAQQFTGPRVELSAGYDSLIGDKRYQDFPHTLDGAHIRGTLGYDTAVSPRVVVGLETSIGVTHDADERVQPGADSFTFTPGRDIDVMARVGYQVEPRTLLYLKAGWTNAALKVVLREMIGQGRYDISEIRSKQDGIRAGVGLEHRLTSSIYAKVEYRYSNYGGGNLYMPDTNRHQILIGAGTRF